MCSIYPSNNNNDDESIVVDILCTFILLLYVMIIYAHSTLKYMCNVNYYYHYYKF